MPTQTPSYADPVNLSDIPRGTRRVKPKLRPPDLRNHRHFVRIKRVPIIDVNTRKYRKGNDVVEEVLDEEQLHRICSNSQGRADKGEYGLVFLGHTTDDGPEVDQPPVTGYLNNFQVGEHNHRPTILADIFMYRDAKPDQILRQFPRRSAEIIGLEDHNGYIDALSLIKRAPERDLGLITHYAMDPNRSRESGSLVRYKSNKRVYRSSCPPGRFCDEGDSHMPVPGLGGAPPRTGKIAKSAMQLLEHLVFEIIEKYAQDPSHHDPSGLGDEGGGLGEEAGLGEEPSGLGEEAGIGEEPSGLDVSGEEPSEAFEEEPSEPSEAFEEEEEEEMPHHRHRHAYAAHEPSGEPSDPSGDPSGHRRFDDQSDSLGSGGTSGTNSMPSQMKSRHKTSRSSRLDPPTHRYDAGAGVAGTPGAYTATPSRASATKAKGSEPFPSKGRPAVPGVGSPKQPSHPQSTTRTRLRKESAPVTRMRQDSERTSVSRYQQENSVLRERIRRLEERAQESDRQAREALMERHIIQLESEGFILDRPAEVTRLARCTNDKEVTREIKRIRRYYRQSPVGQPPIPAVWSDMGGQSQERELTDHQVAEMDTDRFAAAQPADQINGYLDERGLQAVTRFKESRKPSRHRRKPEAE